MAPAGLRTIEDFAKRGYFYLTGDRSKREEFFDFVTSEVKNSLSGGKPDRAGVWLGEIADIIEKKFSTVRISDEVVREAYLWLTENLELIVETGRKSQTGLGRFPPLLLLTRYLPLSYKKGIWQSVSYPILLDTVILIYHTLKFHDRYGKTPDGYPYRQTIELATEAVSNWSLKRVTRLGLARDIEKKKPDEIIHSVIMNEWATGAFERFRAVKDYEAFAFASMLDGLEFLVRGIMQSSFFDDKMFRNALSNAVLRNVQEYDEIFTELYQVVIKGG